MFEHRSVNVCGSPLACGQRCQTRSTKLEGSSHGALGVDDLAALAGGHTSAETDAAYFLDSTNSVRVMHSGLCREGRGD